MNRTKMACTILALSLILVTVAPQPVMANPGSRLDSLLAFLNTRYNKDSQHGYSYTGTIVSRIEPTYSAIYTLDTLGQLSIRPPIINLLATKNFTFNLQWDTVEENDTRYGGFGSFIAGTPDITTTYTAMRAWQILSKHGDIPNIGNIQINATALLIYVNRTHTSSGGFARQPRSTSADMMSTYMALWLLKYGVQLLPDTSQWKDMDLWLPDPSNTTAWILSCRRDGAFMLNPNSKVPGVSPTGAALMALDLLDALNSVPDLQATRNWIISRQVKTTTCGEFIGGFTESVGTNDTNLVSTYYALLGLDTLDALSNIDSDIAIRFILDCQAADGSWGTVPDTAVGSIANIGMAIKCLSLLSNDINALLLEEDPNSQSPSLIDWRLAAIVIIGLSSLVVALVSVKLH